MFNIVEKERFTFTTEDGSGAAATTCAHSSGVEYSSCVAAVEDLMKALDDCFEEAIDAVRAGELEERAQDLGGTKGVGRWRQRGGVEVVD